MFNLEQEATKAFAEKYKAGDKQGVLERLEAEIKYMVDKGLQGDIEKLYIASQLLSDKKAMYYLGGVSAGSFIMYILGISKTNPLPPHYYCYKCKRIEFTGNQVKDGYDLPDRQCNCGSQMLGDGHDLDYRLIMLGATRHSTVISNQNKMMLVCPDNMYREICTRVYGINTKINRDRQYQEVIWHNTIVKSHNYLKDKQIVYRQRLSNQEVRDAILDIWGKDR